jgi:hypothetical protein
MKKWLTESKEALSEAINIANKSDIQIHNLYMLAPIIYSERHNMNNELLMQEMINANDEQVSRDWALDNDSKSHYKFHFVSSYLYCFVLADKKTGVKSCINTCMIARPEAY